MLPDYIDGQFKNKSRIDEKNEVTVLALAGFDDLKLNKEHHINISKADTPRVIPLDITI